MVENILARYNRASTAQIEAGLVWYEEAHNYAKSLGVPIANAAAVISALSPACSWETNKRDAKAMVEKRKGYRFSSYGPNVAKAQRCLQDPGQFSEKTGAKTLNFYHNILDPSNPHWVTIDRHAAAVAEGRTNSGSVRLTVKQYRAYAAAYKEAAFRVGLLPCQLQAIVWIEHIESQNKDVPF